MISSQLIFIREALQTKSIFYRTLLVYSFILIVLGGQLPKLFYLSQLIVITLLGLVLCCNYTEWERDKELKMTLPGYNRVNLISKIFAVLLILLPLFCVTLLSYLRHDSSYLGQVEPMLPFTIKCVVIMMVNLILFRLVNGKVRQGESTVFFRNIRVLCAVAITAIILFISFAYIKSGDSYESTKYIKNDVELTPKSYEPEYRIENPNRLLINFRIEHYNNSQFASYTATKVIDYPVKKDYKFSLSELPNCPDRLKKITMIIYNDHFDFIDTNMSPGHKPHSGKIWKNSGLGNHYDITPQVPWFRRLFQFSDLQPLHKVRLYTGIIPFHTTDSLTEKTAFCQRYSPSISLNYLRDIKLKLRKKTTVVDTSISIPGFGTRRNAPELYNDVPNYVSNYPVLYALLIILLICGFTVGRFINYRMVIYFLVVLVLFIFLDKKLNDRRIKIVQDSRAGVGVRATAVADLNSSIYFRKEGAEAVRVAYSTLSGRAGKILRPYYRYSWLMLLNKPNLCLSDSHQLSEKYNKKANQFYCEIRSRDSLIFNFGKLCDDTGVYLIPRCRYLQNCDSGLFKLESSKCVGKLLGALKNNSVSDYDYVLTFYNKVKDLQGKTRTEQREILENDKPLVFYIILRECRHIEWELSYRKIFGKGYVPKIDEVTEVNEEKQVEFVLEYLNRDKK